jgi:3-oxoacyl-[acyl-carrier protein] reductase
MKPTALVTGASRGIGNAVARKLAETHNITAVARNADLLATLAADIESGGGKCETIALDLTDWDAVESKLAKLDIDVLVNNAGTGPMKTLLETTPREWHRIVDLNFSALYHVTRAALPAMIERRSGHIVMIGSIAGRSAFVGGTCYAATKHAVQAFAECLHLEVRDHGVKVSVVNPGSVASDFSSRPRDNTRRLSPEAVANTVAAVVNTPSDVLIHSIEVRILSTSPGK